MRAHALALAVGFLALPASAEEERNPTYGFRYQVPEGWFPVLRQEVEALDARLGEQLKAQKGVTSVLGYARQPGGRLVFPYVLFQVQPDGVRGATVEDVKASFGVVGDVIREADARPGHLSEAPVEAPTLDLPRRRVLLTKHEVIDGTPVRSVSSLLLGNDQTVGLHCYAEAQAFEAALPGCQQWFEHFKLDPEKVWEPVGGTGRFVGVARSVMQVALLGGAAALVSAVLIMMRRRRQAGVDQAPPEAPRGEA
jgi:hypothetical protein